MANIPSNLGVPSPVRVVPTSICYLCGLALCEPLSTDHVPPKQLYASDVRRQNNPSKLLTIPVHLECNKSYQLDEDYFVHSLMPFARGSYAGNAIYKELLEKFRKGKNVKLANSVLREFDPRPSGIRLPAGRIAKRFNGTRMKRVGWKIVRGLYFHHHDVALPERLIVGMSVTAPGETPPDHFLRFVELPDNPPHGRYPGVFDYRFQKFQEVNNFHYWALLLWDRIIITLMFHDPECLCDACRSDRQSALVD